MKIIKKQITDGYIASYFDISQAEPRTIAYRSGDPVFIDLYEHGVGDAYKELATRRWLAAHDYPTGFDSPGRAVVDKDWVAEQRSLYKTLILAGFYGQSIKNLSKKAGVSYDVGKEIWEGFTGPLTKVKEYMKESSEYAKQYGFVKTILGEKIPLEPDKYKDATNYRTQSFTAVILACFFYNCIERALNLGIDASPKMVIHDSETIEFPIKNLFHMDLVCRKYVRQACKKYFMVDYKFDWDLMFDLMKHIPYTYNIDTGEAMFTMWSEKVDYFLDHLSIGYRFKVLTRDNFIDGHGEGARRLIETTCNKYHMVIEDEDFRQYNQTRLKLKLTEPLKNIEWWSEPLEDTFLEHVNAIRTLNGINPNMDKPEPILEPKQDIAKKPAKDQDVPVSAKKPRSNQTVILGENSSPIQLNLF